jgi:hypothetical protein
MLRGYDQEKTQAVEPQELRDMRLKQEAYSNMCGQAQRAIVKVSR